MNILGGIIYTYIKHREKTKQMASGRRKSLENGINANDLKTRPSTKLTDPCKGEEETDMQMNTDKGYTVRDYKWSSSSFVGPAPTSSTYSICTRPPAPLMTLRKPNPNPSEI